MIATDAQSLITAANGLQRIFGRPLQEQVIIWLLGQWANATAALPSVTLVDDGSELFSWSSSLTPAYWNVYQSYDGGVSYQLYTQYPGTTTDGGGTGTGNLVYVVGVNASNVPVTQNSNIITQT